MTDLTNGSLDAVLAGSIPAGSGAIGLLSSDEFLDPVADFDRAMLAASGSRVALIVAAAGLAGATQAGRNGIAHYRRLGADPIVVDVLERGDATADRLPEYDMLFMCGGSPRALLRCLAGSPLWSAALERWRAGAALAGSSAGAMALCTQCLVPGPGDRVPTRWTQGLGPVDGCALAVHASSRSEEWLRAVAKDAPRPILALDDMTGVVAAAGTPPVVRGPGRIRFVTA